MGDHMIYLDNAATTFPKPREVLERMVETYSQLGVSPGRGSYDLAVEAEQLVTDARRKLARLFGAPDPDRVTFASNATDALNLAIQGIVHPGDHVVSTRLEHNSVLRPLHHLKTRGWIDYDLVPFDSQGFVDPDTMARYIRPNTRLAVVSHASNVLGTIQPVPDIARVCAEHGVPLLVDVAQSAGQIPIDMEGWQVDAIAFTGHKGLLGPSGIGGLACSPTLKLDSTRFGGTGVESRSPVHTQSFPHRLEAGTLNLLGIIGLSAGLDHLEREGIAIIRNREMALFRRLRNGLEALAGVRLYNSPPEERAVPLLICNVDGLNPTDVGAILDGDYGIAVRTGLHCAPLVHADLGTDSKGAVRFSLGYLNSDADIDATIAAMADISRRGLGR
jgi:cysteine desulfurase / selenocysteine lyase